MGCHDCFCSRCSCGSCRGGCDRFQVVAPKAHAKAVSTVLAMNVSIAPVEADSTILVVEAPMTRAGAVSMDLAVNALMPYAGADLILFCSGSSNAATRADMTGMAVDPLMAHVWADLMAFGVFASMTHEGAVLMFLEASSESTYAVDEDLCGLDVFGCGCCDDFCGR